MANYPQYGFQPQQTWIQPRQQMPQQYPMQDFNFQMPQQMQQPGVICRPVASIDEARATPTDFSGNALVLTDLPHGIIYTKMLDTQTGSAVFGVYQRVQEPPTTAAQMAQEYAPLSLVQEMRQEIMMLKSALEGRGKHEAEVFTE